MVKGVTKSGFEFEVREDVADDMKVLRAMRKARKDGTYFDEAIELILGEEQTEKLYDHLEKKEGRATTAAADREITEIVTFAGEDAKNS